MTTDCIPSIHHVCSGTNNAWNGAATSSGIMLLFAYISLDFLIPKALPFEILVVHLCKCCVFVQIPSIEQPPPQHSQQSTQLTQQSNIQATQSLTGQVGMKDQAVASQMQTPARMQHQNQPAMAISSAASPAVHIHSQPTPLHPLQTPQQPKGHLHPQVTATSLPQASQLQNLPTLPLHSSSQPPPLHQSQMPTPSGQLQQPLQTTGIPHLPLQPPLPPQPRPPSMGNFQHQYPPQGFQHAGPQHLSQPMFHVSIRLRFTCYY